MNARLPKGILTISIDLEVDAAQPGRAAQRSLEELTFWLLEVLNRHAMPATWAVTDPAASAASERIMSLGAGHEIAILGDPSWVGREAGRSRFGRELARRTERGRGAGPAVSTLVLRSAELGDYSDLAIKQGLTAVRHAPGPGSAGRQPQTLRFGLWSFPVSLTLPGANRWLPGGGGLRAARVGIDRAIAARGLFQLAIDATQLVARGNSAQRLVERVLEHAERRRQQCVLDVASLRGAADTLSGQHQSRPSRSILRPAA